MSRRAEQLPKKSPTERLCENQKQILDRFISTLRAEIPSVDSASDSLLADSLPDFVNEICKRLEHPDNNALVQGIQDIGKQHASTRIRISGYNLIQVLTEYHILRRLIVDFLIQSGGLTLRERRMINEAIDIGIAFAGQEYFEQWTRQQREIIDRLSSERLVRERFLYAVTHDLRGPLTSVKMGIQLALRKVEASNEFVRHLLDNSFQALTRMERMIADLLDFARIEGSAELPITIAQVNLKQLAGELISQTQLQIQNQLILEGLDSFVPCDPIYVKRALENLIGNAAKYGEANSPITVIIGDSAEWGEISVFNRGDPIPSETRTVMFEPFRRGAEVSNTKGWGLGLFLVKTIVEAHHGRIDLESSSEIHGSRFTLNFPKHLAETPGLSKSA